MVKWTYEIRYGPEGEDIYAWVRDDRGDLVCNAKTYHAIAIVEAANAAKLREGAEPVAWWVHDFHVARQPVKARGKFEEPTEYLYPASREEHAREAARIMGGTCTPLYLHPAEQTNARSGVSDWIFYNPDHHDQPPSQDTIVEGFCMITGSWGEPCAAVHVPWKGVNRVVVYRILSALSPAAPEGRFAKLSPDAPATIREDADEHLVFLSTAELVAAPEGEQEAVTLTYKNWRGEIAERTIVPKHVWFGSTDWHPEPQWLLTAFDIEKQADRDFALRDFGKSLSRPTERAVTEAEIAKTEAINMLLKADDVWTDYGSGFRVHFRFSPNSDMRVVERINTARALALEGK